METACIQRVLYEYHLTRNRDLGH